jgi:hypothetical protein
MMAYTCYVCSPARQQVEKECGCDGHDCEAGGKGDEDLLEPTLVVGRGVRVRNVNALVRAQVNHCNDLLTVTYIYQKLQK